MPLVKVNMLKAETMETVTRKINENLSVAPEDIFIVIEEPPLDNWGMAGKQKSEG